MNTRVCPQFAELSQKDLILENRSAAYMRVCEQRIAENQGFMASSVELKTHPKLYYSTCGEGEELVLLHGWGFHSGIWESVLPFLVKHYRVTVVDLPGFGRSPLSNGRYLLEEIVQALLEVAPARAMWLGWSLGGLFALFISANFPERVEKLIYVASTPKFCADTEWPGMQEGVLDNFAQELFSNYRATLTRFLSLQLPKDSTTQMKINLRHLREELFRYGEPKLAALKGGLALLRETDLRSQLSQIRCPVLGIYGRLDALVPVAIADEMQRLIKQIKIHVIDGANHAPFLSHTELFSRYLIDIAEG